MTDPALVEGSPPTLDVRLRRRTAIPLPEDGLVAVERINRGKSPAPNLRWLLTEDGGLSLARHSGDTADWQTPFDTPLPPAPNATLSPEQVDVVRRALADAHLAGTPDYLTDPRVEDGGFTIVTARVDGAPHEFVFEAVTNPLVRTLLRVADEWAADDSENSDDEEDW